MTLRLELATLRFASAAAVLLLLAGCGPRTHVAPIQRPGEGDFDVITSFNIRDGQASNRQKTPVPPGAYRFGWFPRPAPGLRPLPGAGARSKLHPALLRRLALGPSAVVEEVVVTFADTLRIPRFSTNGLWTGGAAADTTSAKASVAQAMIDQIRVRRSVGRAADSAAMTSLGATVGDDSFWLTRTLVIGIQRDRLLLLAASPGVVHVRPAGPTEPPPQRNSSGVDDPYRARWWVGADPYYVENLQRGKLALLDTGVSSTDPSGATLHEMFGAPNQFGVRADLVNPPVSATAPPYQDSDLSPNPGHGTMSAGIINGRLPETATDYNVSRGLTRIAIDSYRIYSPSGSTNTSNSGVAYSSSEPGLEGDALQHALESTFLRVGGVIVVEAQAEDPQDSGISWAADGAFDGGAVIVAANGNIDSGDQTPDVRAPANARKVLGIGAYSVRYGDTAVEQIPGPAADLRIKPDLQAPTGYETAGKGSSTSYGGHGGTSGATAVAGAAAALFRNLLLDESESVDPGFVYAGLIASAKQPAPYDKHVNGAGRLTLPDRCKIWMLKLALSHEEIYEDEFDAAGLALTAVSAAAWWPERNNELDGVPLDTHSEIALTLKAGDAGGSPTASSEDKESVFQRVGFQVASPVTSLAVRVHAKTVREGPQTVYLVVLGYEAATP